MKIKYPKWIKCSHKAIEYRTYIARKTDGYFGLFPDIFCSECELSRKLKVPPTNH